MRGFSYQLLNLVALIILFSLPRLNTGEPLIISDRGNDVVGTTLLSMLACLGLMEAENGEKPPEKRTCLFRRKESILFLMCLMI